MRLFKSLRFYFGDILDHTSVFVLFLPVLTDSFSFENLFDTLSPVVCTTKRLKTLMKMSILWMASAIHCSCIHTNRYPVRLQITLTATMTPCRLVFYQVDMGSNPDRAWIFFNPFARLERNEYFVTFWILFSVVFKDKCGILLKTKTIMYAAHKYHLFSWLNKKSLFIQRALHFFLNRLMVILLIWWFSLTGSSSRPQSARILRPCHPSPECWWWTTEDVPLLCVVIVLYFKVVDNVLKKMLLTVSC